MTLSDAVGITLLSLRVALVATAAIILPGIALGWALARGRFRGKTLIETFVFLPMVLPPVAVGLALLMTFSRDAPVGRMIIGIFGSPILLTWWAAALAAAVMSFPFVVLGARQGFEAVPRRLEAVAESLGAPPRRVLLSIALPLALPSIARGTLFAFARALGEFGATTLVAGNIPGRTETLALAIYGRIEAFQDREAVLLSCVSVALALVITGAAHAMLRVRR